jgi:ATP-dependent protease ClpP protease subunit
MNSRTVVLGGPSWLLTKSPHVVHVTGDIDESSLVSFTEDFGRAVASGQRTIPIVIHSGGGELCCALNMLGQMKSAPAKIVTVVPGQAYSAAALLFSGGNERYISEVATVMLHQVSLGAVSGSARQITNEAKELERANEMAFRCVERNTGNPHGFFSSMVLGAADDVYLDATQCLQLRIATHIGLPHMEVEIGVNIRIGLESWSAGQVIVMEPPSSSRAKSASKNNEEDDDDDD